MKHSETINAVSRTSELACSRPWRMAGVMGFGLMVAVTLMPIAPASAQLAAPSAPNTFADIVEKVKPAVVSIRVSSVATRLSRNEERRDRGSLPFPHLDPDHPFNEMFKNFRGGQGGPVPRPRRAQGSGFVISPDGFVVTNNHVIRGGKQITVSFDEKTNYDAELIGRDPRTDLALLKIKSEEEFPYVKFATQKSRVGDWVIAVGNPFGLGGTVTVGILSAQGRDIGSGPYDFIQVDAAVNRGNSGGPTFNLQGDVIGVNTAIYSPSGGNVGIAFAVPASTAVEVIEQLKKSGSVSRGWLGVRIQTISEDVAASLGLSEPHGALISDVTADGPAEKSDLRSGDAILKINGSKIEDSRDLARKIAEFEPGTKIDVAIRRGDRNLTIPVDLGTFPGDFTQDKEKEETDPAEPTALADLGLALAPASDGTKGVVVLRVDETSDAAEKGIQRGDVILQINNKDVAKPSDVDDVVKAAKKRGRKAVLVTIQRGNDKLFIGLQLKTSG